MSAERQFAVAGDWALASDGLQWILQRRYLLKGELAWRSVSFVRSTRDVLERCMREKATPQEVVTLVLGQAAPDAVCGGVP